MLLWKQVLTNQNRVRHASCDFIGHKFKNCDVILRFNVTFYFLYISSFLALFKSRAASHRIRFQRPVKGKKINWESKP